MGCRASGRGLRRPVRGGRRRGLRRASSAVWGRRAVCIGGGACRATGLSLSSRRRETGNADCTAGRVVGLCCLN